MLVGVEEADPMLSRQRSELVRRGFWIAERDAEVIEVLLSSTRREEHQHPAAVRTRLIAVWDAVRQNMKQSGPAATCSSPQTNASST